MISSPLPVWAIFKRSYEYVWELRSLLWVPLLVVFLVNFVGTLCLDAVLKPAAVTPGQANIGISLLRTGCSFLMALLGMSFAVGVHRTVLLGEMRQGIGVLCWDRGLWRYLGASLLLGLFIFLLTFAGLIGLSIGGGSKMVVGVGVIAYLAGCVWLQRLFLSLPAAAIGEPKRLALSWRITHGNLMRLTAVNILTILPVLGSGLLISIPQMLAMLPALRAGIPVVPPQPSIIHMALASAVTTVATPVFAVTLSLCYDVLARGGGPRPDSVA